LAIEELVGGVKLVMKTKPITQHNNTSFNLQFGFFSPLYIYSFKKNLLKKIILCIWERGIWRHTFVMKFHFREEKSGSKGGKGNLVLNFTRIKLQELFSTNKFLY